MPVEHPASSPLLDSRVVFALDFPSVERARSAALAVRDAVGMLNVGLGGPSMLRRAVERTNKEGAGFEIVDAADPAAAAREIANEARAAGAARTASGR